MHTVALSLWLDIEAARNGPEVGVYRSLCFHSQRSKNALVYVQYRSCHVEPLRIKLPSPSHAPPVPASL